MSSEGEARLGHRSRRMARSRPARPRGTQLPSGASAAHGWSAASAAGGTGGAGGSRSHLEHRAYPGAVQPARTPDMAMAHPRHREFVAVVPSPRQREVLLADWVHRAGGAERVACSRCHGDGCAAVGAKARLPCTTSRSPLPVRSSEMVYSCTWHVHTPWRPRPYAAARIARDDWTPHKVAFPCLASKYILCVTACKW